jgi:general stress protein 26
MKTTLETPNEIRSQIWQELSRAARDRHHAWRTPVIATARKDGSVNARTVVLRNVDKNEGLLQIFTDARSAKATELMSQPESVFVFWSSRLSWQLRVSVNVTLLSKGPLVERLWNEVKESPSASDYLSSFVPGTPLLQSSNKTKDETFDTSHCAVLNAQVLEIDWLELARTGHRRARLTADSWEWLVP